MLNTTDSETGRRLVLAPVVIGDGTPDRGDIATLLGDNGVRLSTAVLLSARFPGISPAGRIPASDKPGHEYRIVDGGYADNSGAASALEALLAVEQAANELHIGDRIQPVAVVIRNDPVSSEPPPPIPAPVAEGDVSMLGALIDPVATLDRLRQTNTQRARHELMSAVRSFGGCILDGFDLHHDPETTFVLGWMLAPRARDAMAVQLDRMQSDKASHLYFAGTLANESRQQRASCPSTEVRATE